MTELVTKELTPETWQDFEWFFSQGNGWDHCGCTAYQGLRAPRDLRSWSEKRDWNLEAKCSLVDEGLAHGILVYADETPVGWCQFGPSTELPLQHDVKSGPPSLASSETPWRITCFCTAKDWRGQRVAELALRSALTAIQKSGGGIVDAYPIPVMPNDDELDALIRSHGGRSAEVREYLVATTSATQVTYYDGRPFSLEGVVVNGIGPLTVLVRRMAGALHPGTLSMFQAEGFLPVATIPPTSKVRPVNRVAVRRTVTTLD